MKLLIWVETENDSKPYTSKCRVIIIMSDNIVTLKTVWKLLKSVYI